MLSILWVEGGWETQNGNKITRIGGICEDSRRFIIHLSYLKTQSEVLPLRCRVFMDYWHTRTLTFSVDIMCKASFACMVVGSRVATVLLCFWNIL